MDKNKHFFGISPEKPPKRLFRAIVKRLILEKNLKLFKGKLSVFSVALFTSVILIIFAFFIFKSELAESEAGFLFSLLFSDTTEVFLYFGYFISAISESIPIAAIIISIFSIFSVMVCLRFVVKYYDKILIINKLTKKH